MKNSDAHRYGIVASGTLVASAIIAFLSIIGFIVVPIATEPQADMRIEPTSGVVKIGETFTVTVLVSARTPVNVFKGEIEFDHTKMYVDAIDYNTSIADLWAERPWYQNGDGTLGFIGGTTMRGGFTGNGELITITFRTTSDGAAAIRFHEARILEHDGLGTDVPLILPIDSIFSFEESVINNETVAEPESSVATIAVVKELPSTDMNGDGAHTLADISIFMLNMLGSEARYDLNVDGKVDAKDLSIMMSAK